MSPLEDGQEALDLYTQHDKIYAKLESSVTMVDIYKLYMSCTHDELATLCIAKNIEFSKLKEAYLNVTQEGLEK